MDLTTFIRRPVLSAVISVLIVLTGLVSLRGLPVEQYPDMAPPTVNVFTTYAGADAETVIKSVITPLEESINGVEGMLYMTSTASDTGEANVTVYFKNGVNPDMAAVNVQNRVQSALANLPAEVTRQGVTTEKEQNSELMTLALSSEDGSFDEIFLNNYMNINVVPRLRRISGVGKVSLFGSDYNMRLWLKSDKMAHYRLVPADIEAALAGQNIEAATGAFGENHDGAKVSTMKYRGRFSTPEEFGDIVLRSLPEGGILRLKDVADVEMGSENYNYANTLDSRPAAMAMIKQRAGANASSIINEIDRELERMAEQLPPGLKFHKVDDANRFLYAAIRVVVRTLCEAMILVILVVRLFLRDFRATLIPAVGLFVSLVGTFAFMRMAGFSINLLTLFALVLAIGTVVDDAIIVVEAARARFDQGCRSPFLAARDAMGNIARALAVSTLIFMAVFIPVSLIGGTSGAFYRQFGLTMAAAVGISAINALTLSPALCALLPRPHAETEKRPGLAALAASMGRAFDAAFKAVSRAYVAAALWCLRRVYLAFVVIAVSGALLLVLVRITPTGLVPDEDTGMLFVNMATKPGTSMSENAKALDKMAARLETIPGIAHSAMTNGFSFTASGANAGMFFVTLKDWGERGKDESLDAITEKINEAAKSIPEAETLVMRPSMIPGFGMGGGFELHLQDRAGGDIAAFQKVKDAFVAELARQPEIGEAYSEFRADYPQHRVEIDAAQCLRAGIAPNAILETIAAYYGGHSISNFNRFSRLYNVTMQAPPGDRASPDSLDRVFARAESGEPAPVSRFVRLTRTTGPQNLSRFNLFSSIAVTGSPAPGRSNGEAMRAVERVAKRVLPPGYGFEYGGLTLEESRSSGNFGLVFLLSFLIIYLVLAALYESLILPFAVILAVPSGILGSFLAARAFGLHNDIYMQTGVVLLIGLLAKTGILITEYAVERRREGMGLAQAARDAARERFRPILMTLLAMILGFLPLLAAAGAGANGSRSLAACVVGGLLLGSVALLFLVPALFVVFQWAEERWMPRRLMDCPEAREERP